MQIDQNSSNNTSSLGLGSKWHDVLQVLGDIIPIYDKVNYYISFGQDEKLRHKGISFAHKNDLILDAGSGFGNMTKTARKIFDNEVKIVMYDPLVPMLKGAKSRFDKVPDLSCGVFEHMPFTNEQFDVVMCGYSLRDAINLKTAIAEAHRVLKTDGKWIIVDLGKPDNLMIRLPAYGYLRFFLPFIAFIIGGKLGLKFGVLFDTYKRWPKNKILKSLLLEKFSNVKLETKMFGSAIIIIATK